MKALVTGASGFIGSSIARKLEDMQCRVYPLGHGRGQGAHDHDAESVLDLRAVDAAVEDMDFVFHLAGLLGTTELLSRSAEAVDVNIKGTVNVLEACKRQAVGTVFYPTKPSVWLNTYTITKRAGEEFARMYAVLHGLDVRILRWLNVYGPGQSLFPVRKAVPVMILQGLHNLDIEVYGTGEQSVFLTYVDDVARNAVLYTFEERGDSVVRDSGNDVQMTVNELADMIRTLTNSKAGICHLPMRLGEDPKKAVEPLAGPTAADLLGLGEATTPLEEGMRATIEYYSRLPTEHLGHALAYYYGGKRNPHAS